MTFELFEYIVEQIPRLATTNHSKVLYGLIRWLKPQSVVETGCWFGYTSCWMARALKDNGSGYLLCIDDFSLNPEALSQFYNNVAGLELASQISLASTKSTNALMWPNRVDMAYIDGDHSLEGCKTDLRLAIERGAHCLVIHDTVSWWGPRLALDWLRSEGFSIIETHQDEGLAIAMKNKTKPPESYSQKNFPLGKV